MNITIKVLTVVSSDDRMMVRSRLNNDFDLWVLTSECGKIFLNVVTGRSSFMSGSNIVALSINSYIMPLLDPHRSQ